MHLKSSSTKLWSFCSGLRALTIRVLNPGYFETIRSIDPSNKSHNVLGKYPTMHHFVTEMCTRVHISVTKWCIVGSGTGALWDLCNRSIPWLISLAPCVASTWTTMVLYSLWEFKNSLSSTSEDFKYIRHICVEMMQISFYVQSEKMNQ